MLTVRTTAFEPAALGDGAPAEAGEWHSCATCLRDGNHDLFGAAHIRDIEYFSAELSRARGPAFGLDMIEDLVYVRFTRQTKYNMMARGADDPSKLELHDMMVMTGLGPSARWLDTSPRVELMTQYSVRVHNSMHLSRPQRWCPRRSWRRRGTAPAARGGSARRWPAASARSWRLPRSSCRVCVGTGGSRLGFSVRVRVQVKVGDAMQTSVGRRCGGCGGWSP